MVFKARLKGAAFEKCARMAVAVGKNKKERRSLCMKKAAQAQKMDEDVRPLLQLLPDERVEELLEGGLKIIQNTNLYRFTSDSVLLSRFVKGKKGDVVADFCSGSGIVGMHFFALNPHIATVTLFEMQEELFRLSEKSIALNSLQNFKAVHCKVQEIGREFDEYFSLILCNPPYETGGFEKEDYKKAICRKEITVTLREIVASAAKKLRFGGRLALVHRADRLAEVLYTMKEFGIEPKRLQLVRGRALSKPYLILAEGKKGGKCGIDILPDAINVLN